MNEYMIVLAGVLVRIAIPLVVLLGLAILLGRLDAHWKRESIQQEKELKVLNDTPACWDVKHCTPEKMAACPAVKTDEPCWQVFRLENGDFDPDCLTCEVFLTAAGPVPATITAH